MKTLVLAILATLAFAADPVLSPSAQAALDKAEASVTANRVAYDKANAVALTNAEKALKAEQDRLTKAGDLEGAVAIRKVIEGFRVDLVTKVDEKAKVEAGKDILGMPVSTGLVIVSAKWGNGDKTADVTKIVQKSVNHANSSVSFLASHVTLGDPAPGMVKSLEVSYTLGTETKTVSVTDSSGAGVLLEINVKK